MSYNEVRVLQEDSRGNLWIGTTFGLNKWSNGQIEQENERQHRFAEQLIDQQEVERKRIALELHDGIGQQIMLIPNRVQLANIYISGTHALLKYAVEQKFQF